MSSSLNRRNLIKKVIAGSAAMAAGVVIPSSVLASIPSKEESTSLKGNIRHSVCRWCYSDMPLEKLCELVKEIGFNAIDLLKPNEWPIAKQYGIDCSMCSTS